MRLEADVDTSQARQWKANVSSSGLGRSTAGDEPAYVEEASSVWPSSAAGRAGRDSTAASTACRGTCGPGMRSATYTWSGMREHRGRRG